MLIYDIFQWFGVTGCLIALLIFPCLFLSYLLTNIKEWPDVVLSAIILGCSIQSITGLIWSHSVAGKPFLEALFFLAVCILSTLLALYTRRIQSEDKKEPDWYRWHVFLPAILIAAFLVRSIHPLQTYALGQSDAYTHLHYLHYIVDQGYLANVAYPSGYHWLLALPVLIFNLDPYSVTRFSGAFFGTALVLAIYVFLDRLFNRRSAVFGSFCAACFPGMILLMKTGVGSFANQFGLFLVPCLLYLYTQVLRRNGKNSGHRVVILSALLGFAATVPMMLVHIFIIFSLERFFSLWNSRKYWLHQTVLVMLLCLPAVLLIAFHFSQLGPGQRIKTAEVLMEYSGKKKVVAEKTTTKGYSVGKKSTYNETGLAKIAAENPYFKLLVDLFTVKRIGFSNLYINLIGGILFFLFLYYLCYGLYHGRVELLLLGIWGGLTTIQAATGFLQFSSYQREGWSLLIATCCLSGLIAGWVYERISNNRIVMVGTVMLMIISAWWTIQHPPQHPTIQSSAEDLIIRFVRFFSRDRLALFKDCNNNESNSFCKTSRLLVGDIPLTVVTRKFVGWYNQGEIVPNVMQRPSPAQSMQVSVKGVKELFATNRQYLVLIDRQKTAKPEDTASAFAMVAPGQFATTLKKQKHLYRANSKILEYMRSLSKNKWQVYTEGLSDNLTAYIVIPKRTN